MTKLIILLLTLLPVLSYSQVTSINVDTSIHQVIIINNGTMIENNGGTVNIGSESKVKMNLGKMILDVTVILIKVNAGYIVPKILLC